MKKGKFIVTELEKAQQGYLYDAKNDKELLELRLKCADLCYEFNNCKPSDIEQQQKLIKKIVGETKDTFAITPPFRCDYGFNISIGKEFYSNYNCTILDCAKVTFGDYVLVAPNCVFSTAGHAIDPERRKVWIEIALPITIKDNVWIGANVTVLPGVTIGENSIIGAGSVVTKDIPSNVIAVGNPCKVLRQLTDEDKEKYPEYKE